MKTPSETFRLELIIDGSELDQHAFGRLWAGLNDPLLQTETFGAYSLQFPFDAEPRAAEELLRKSRRIASSGAGGRASTVLEWRKVVSFILWLELSSWDERLGEWTLGLFRDLPVTYGCACSLREYDAHHRVDTLTQRGGVVSGDVGTTVDFPAYLPGVYWMSFFGSALSSGLALDALDSLAGVERTTPAPAKTLVALEGPIFGADLAERLALARRVAARLGDDYFYDGERPDRVLRTVPALEPLRQRLEVNT